MTCPAYQHAQLLETQVMSLPVQALRDKSAHTYVIRRDPSPAGTGRIAYAHYTLLGTS
ncbi:MAG TPA: hypothetical protein VNN25_22975 [Thermoanaerobaculia bacterium]|nr:hypothetical protein [Thermoanaerobaculia bacterium]